MPEQMNKATLLELIEVEHRHLKSILAELSEEEMTTSGVVGAWSVKDILIHIIVHEQRMINWVENKLHGTMTKMPQPYDMPEDDLRRVNEQIFMENRDQSLTEVFIELDKSYEQSVAMVKDASEVDLINPERYSLEGGEPLWKAVAANTYEHYQEHGQDIRIWRQKEGK